MHQPKLFIIIIVLAAAVGVVAINLNKKNVPETKVPSVIVPKRLVTLSITDFPEMIKVGKTSEFTWKIETAIPVVTTHTAIHYGTLSHAGEYADASGPELVGYPKLTGDYLDRASDIPGIFTAKIIAAPDDAPAMFARAHVVVAGKHYWSPQIEIKVQK